MKPGDKIVCILNIRGAYDPSPRLYVDKIYTVKKCNISGLFGHTKYSIYIEEHPQYTYSEDCFITNIEYRKNKLKKIIKNK